MKEKKTPAKEEKPDKSILEKKYPINEAIKLTKQYNNKKKFNQSIDVCIILRQIDMKKQENKIKENVFLKDNCGIKKKVFAIGRNLCVNAKGIADKVFNDDDLNKLTKDKKKMKKFSKEYDYLIAEPEYMLKIAKQMGRILGPIGKMPQAIAPNIDPKPLIEKLNSSIKIITTNNNAIQFSIGKENADDSKLENNFNTILNLIKNKLPQKTQNIKNIYLKTSMGKKIQVKI
ncbi:MAG: hypothetical protein B6U87_01235 [Candidatus Aenigmarchaeota archaeon ex4484_52]|nr:MAG: hypothetical protein B6U87_01235 [Candidatus Aenigmarchaeota archaeon ex4484_52]